MKPKRAKGQSKDDEVLVPQTKTYCKGLKCKLETTWLLFATDAYLSKVQRKCTVCDYEHIAEPSWQEYHDEHEKRSCKVCEAIHDDHAVDQVTVACFKELRRQYDELRNDLDDIKSRLRSIGGGRDYY